MKMVLMTDKMYTEEVMKKRSQESYVCQVVA